MAASGNSLATGAAIQEEHLIPVLKWSISESLVCSDKRTLHGEARRADAELQKVEPTGRQPFREARIVKSTKDPKVFTTVYFDHDGGLIFWELQ